MYRKKTSGFRLISLLSVLSIVLEKIIEEQLITYFYSNNLMTNNQYGFRLDKKNISNALFDVSKYFNTAISCIEKSELVFLDVKKAFNSVNREVLKKTESFSSLRQCFGFVPIIFIK